MFVLRGFYAHHDTRTPFIVNVGENALNIVLAFVLVRQYGVLGLGLAFALAYLVSAMWAVKVLSYKVRGFTLRPILASFWRMLLAAVLMAAAVWLITRDVEPDSGWQAFAQLIVGGTVGVIVYVCVLFAVGAPEIDSIRRRLPGRHTDVSEGSET